MDKNASANLEYSFQVTRPSATSSQSAAFQLQFGCHGPRISSAPWAWVTLKANWSSIISSSYMIPPKKRAPAYANSFLVSSHFQNPTSLGIVMLQRKSFHASHPTRLKVKATDFATEMLSLILQYCSLRHAITSAANGDAGYSTTLLKISEGRSSTVVCGE